MLPLARLLRHCRSSRRLLPPLPPPPLPPSLQTFRRPISTDLTESRLAALDVDADGYRLPQPVLDRLLTPALVVYEDKLRHNVDAIVNTLCGGDPNRWRPHVKTTKSTRIWSELVRAGVRNYKCATPREALVLGQLLREAGVAEEADICLAYPLVGPNLARLEQVGRLIAPVRLSVLVEDVEAATQVPASIGVFVDINPPTMDRTGMPLARAESGGVAEIMDALSAAGRPTSGAFRGLHFYDGHAAQWPSGEERRDELWPLYDRVCRLVEGLPGPVEEVITSGTHSMTASLAHPGLAAGAGARAGARAGAGARARAGAEAAAGGWPTTTHHRASPGTLVLYDLKTEMHNDDLGDLLVPAALVVSRVVSHPTSTGASASAGETYQRIVTADAGTKAIASEVEDPVGMVLGQPLLEALPPNEEHLPILCPPPPPLLAGQPSPPLLPPAPARGDVLYICPRHVCPTVNLAEQALLVKSDGTCETFDVDARAHELLLSPLAEATSVTATAAA